MLAPLIPLHTMFEPQQLTSHGIPPHTKVGPLQLPSPRQDVTQPPPRQSMVAFEHVIAPTQWTVHELAIEQSTPL